MNSSKISNNLQLNKKSVNQNTTNKIDPNKGKANITQVVEEKKKIVRLKSMATINFGGNILLLC